MKERIQIDDLNLYYGDFQALKDINMKIKHREITAFIGASGSGKSTLLRTLNRMNDLIDGCTITGKITLDGINIYKKIDVNLLRKKVGMVFQKPNPFPMSVFENVAYGPKTHGVKNKSELNEIVEQALVQAGLFSEVKDKLGQSALGLSGGQQQRLCIARAIAVNPEVLLMDEPTSALDPLSTQTIEDLCSQLKSSYTIIIVTHNMQQAKRLADKTAFFHLGELVEYDTTKNIFDNPQEKQTRRYTKGKFG